MNVTNVTHKETFNDGPMYLRNLISRITNKISIGGKHVKGQIIRIWVSIYHACHISRQKNTICMATAHVNKYGRKGLNKMESDS